MKPTNRLPGTGPIRLWLVALPLLFTTAASCAGQTVWRCTDSQGQVSYSASACEGQEAQQRQVRDDRTDTQYHQANKTLERDAKLARQMRRQRLREERTAKAAGPGALTSTRPHVIEARVNDHKPVPITDMTRPIKMPSPKKGGHKPSTDGVQAGTSPLHR